MSSPEILQLLLKMIFAASIVVTVSIIAERASPFIAAMVATLPVSAGPAMLFLAMGHGDVFMREALGAAVLANVATGFFCFGYGFLAQRHNTALALGGTLTGWAFLSILMRQSGFGLFAGLLASTAVYGMMIHLSREWAKARAAFVPPRPWYALPLRAGGVAVLVAAVTTLSQIIGPAGSGLLAVIPIVMSSLVVILQPRIGGPATAAVIVNGLPGMLGFGFALAVAALLVEPVGRYWALLAGLLASFAWNGALVVLNRR